MMVDEMRRELSSTIGRPMKKAPGPDPLFDADRGRRAVRSFVLREGRLTPAQERALEELWPRFGLDNGHEAIDFTRVFGRTAPLILEIGFGNGRTLAAMAAAAPENDFLGVEVHRPGVGALLNRIETDGLENLRVLCADAVQVLRERIRPGALSGLRIYFPDPWPKKRHHKRRLIQPAFVHLAAERLAPGGVMHLATDWLPYAEHMLEVLSAEGLLQNLGGPDGFAPRPAWRPETHFERRGLRLGHGVRDLLFERRPALDAAGS